jgi:hypothetical protein
MSPQKKARKVEIVITNVANPYNWELQYNSERQSQRPSGYAIISSYLRMGCKNVKALPVMWGSDFKPIKSSSKITHLHTLILTFLD